MLTRREMLLAGGVGAALIACPNLLTAAAKEESGFTLPKLPYAYDFLEPVIDAETMTIHHDKHHQAYVDNLNKALAGSDLLKKPIEEILAKIGDVPEKIRTTVRNNGGGHWNHSFFWTLMTKPNKGGEPKGELLTAIEKSFGTVDGFHKEFTAAALGRFGSGWAWLVRGKDKPLAIVSSPNQDNPLMSDEPKPILGIDVWEHAYYLKYRNDRKKYIESWYGVINWEVITENFAKK